MTKYAAAVQGLVMNLLEMKEAWVECTTLSLPIELTEAEDNGTHAV